MKHLFVKFFCDCPSFQLPCNHELHFSFLSDECFYSNVITEFYSDSLPCLVINGGITLLDLQFKL